MHYSADIMYAHRFASLRRRIVDYPALWWAALTRWLRRVLGVTAQIETLRREARETEAAHEAALATLKGEMIEQVEAALLTLQRLAWELHTTTGRSMRLDDRMGYYEKRSGILGELRKAYDRDLARVIAERQAAAEAALKPESSSEPETPAKGAA